jgi:hypothetical protein
MEDEILRDRPSDGVHQECGKGEVATSVPDLPQLAPRISDVDLNKAMDDVLAPTCVQDMQVRLPALEEGPRLKGLGATRPRPVTAHLPAMTWLSTQLANTGTVSRMSTPIAPTA